MISQNILEASDIRQSPQWAKYMESLGWIVKQNGGIQIFIKKFPLLPFSMIKIQHPKGKIDFKEIDKIAKKYNSLAVVIEPHNFKFNEDLFKFNNYKKSKLLFSHSSTFKIDLTLSERKIWGLFSENAKRNIKRALQNKLTTVVKKTWQSDPKDFKDFYKLMRNLEKIKKIYTLSEKEFYKKAESFKKNSFFLFAYYNDEPIAALWLSFFDGVVTYMQTGINEKGYKLNANYLLVWEGMKKGKKYGLKIWDFDAVFDKRFPKEHPRWKGFSEFKSRFHGELIEYPPPQIKIYNPIFKIVYNLAVLLN